MEGNLPFFLCILGQFPSTRYLEGRFNEGFSTLRVWGAYIWRGLYVEGLIFGILRYDSLDRLRFLDKSNLLKIPDCPSFSVLKALTGYWSYSHSVLVICSGQFSFSHRTSQGEPSSPSFDTVFKSSTLPWKNRQQTASWSFS